MTLRSLSLSTLALAVLLPGVCSFASSAEVPGAPPDERSLIEQVARDYLEGWYAADPVRVGRALHPDMVKRRVDSLPAGRQVVFSLTRDQMIEMTRLGGGTKTPLDGRKVSVRVLAVSSGVAIAEASSSEYLEYLSLAKCNGEWMIVGILWRYISPGPHKL